MKNRKIAEVLKAYRKMNNLSVRDVTELLEEKSLKVAEKTVYGWESSATQPDADTLLLLCDIYNERRKQLLAVKPNRGHELVSEMEKFFNVTSISLGTLWAEQALHM